MHESRTNISPLKLTSGGVVCRRPAFHFLSAARQGRVTSRYWPGPVARGGPPINLKFGWFMFDRGRILS
jgi:hypothetical protein